jgi:hypothetical protein
VSEDIDLIKEDRAAEIFDVTVSALRKWRIRGEGPPYVKVGRLVRYSRRDLARWIDAQTVRKS